MLNRVDITYKRMLIYERMFESRGVAEGLIDPFAFCVCLAAAKEAEQRNLKRSDASNVIYVRTS